MNEFLSVNLIEPNISVEVTRVWVILIQNNFAFDIFASCRADYRQTAFSPNC